MIQIQIRYDEPEEIELAEFYKNRILEAHITDIAPVVTVRNPRVKA